MKKITTICIAALISTAFLTSCKKDYTCTCKDSSGTVISTNPLGKMTKKKATDDCNALGSAYTASNTGSCSLN
jgi:hypothetical protein